MRTALPQDVLTVFPPRAAWVTPDGTGYAQQGFSASGPHRLTLTHELLGVARFVCDVTKASWDPSVFLAGTITSSTDAPDSGEQSRRAEWVREQVLKAPEVKDAGTPLELGKRLGWSQAGLRQMLKGALKGRLRRYVYPSRRRATASPSRPCS